MLDPIFIQNVQNLVWFLLVRILHLASSFRLIKLVKCCRFYLLIPPVLLLLLLQLLIIQARFRNLLQLASTRTEIYIFVFALIKYRLYLSDETNALRACQQNFVHRLAGDLT